MLSHSVSTNSQVLDQQSALELHQSSWLRQLDVPAIASRYSTPLYITNRAQLLRNLKSFETLLQGNENIYFPVKVSPCLATFSLLAQKGCGVDCASRREVELAQISGIADTKISYYSPAPDLDLAVSLLQNGSSVIIDSPSRLKALEQMLGDTTFPGKLFLRVNPALYNSYAVKADYQKHTSHGNLSSQFGVPSEDVISLLSETKLPFSGLHIHVGTQMDNVEVFQESLDALHELCRVIHAITPHKIVDLNLGGGLGIASHEGEKFPTVTELSDALKHKFQSQFTYKMEPGNALFGNASALLTKVIARKSSRGKEWAIVDVGSDQLLKVTLAGFSQEVLRSDGTPLPRTGHDSIAGPLCFAGDIILPATNLSDVHEGDLLLLSNAGAYCRAIGTRFNGYSQPATLMVDDENEVGLIYNKEDSYWEPLIQSFKPYNLSASEGTGKTLSEHQLNQIRSVYLHQQCGNDTYFFSQFEKLAARHYEMFVTVESEVAFISAPTVMRIISDAAVAVTIDNLGNSKKDISVWGSRFNVSIDGILRTKRQHRLSVRLTPFFHSSVSNKREMIVYWQLGSEKCSGNLLLVF